MRLIDADALLESARVFEIVACARGCGKSILHLAKAWLFCEVEKAPTIDAVPVVRCKDCNRGKTAVEGDSVWCCCYQMEMELDNFCKNGGEADE